MNPDESSSVQTDWDSGIPPVMLEEVHREAHTHCLDLVRTYQVGGYKEVEVVASTCMAHSLAAALR